MVEFLLEQIIKEVVFWDLRMSLHVLIRHTGHLVQPVGLDQLLEI